MFRHTRSAGCSEEELRFALQKRLRRSRASQAARLDRVGIFLDPEITNPDQRPAGSARPLPAVAQLQKSPARLLLAFAEVSLVLLLGFMLFSALSGVGRINQKSRETWRMTPIPPTPLILPVELPSGHTASQVPVVPWQRQLSIHGYSSPLKEIPDYWENFSSVSEFATRIQIPAIDVDAPIVQGVDKEQLKKGVGQIPGTANPGQVGNMVLSAHNDAYGELFRYLDRLKPGDEFTVLTNLKAYTYVVTGWELVEPDRIEVLAPTPDATATLISCYPYLIDTFRIIVRARLREA
jgi:sortase A